VRACDEAGGGLPVSVRPRPRVDEVRGKIEDWVARSRGKVRADGAHFKLLAWLPGLGAHDAPSGR
jgi:hypothetical protein